MAYKLEGSLLEGGNCDVLCPRWIGVDPDNGSCDSARAHHFGKGQIDGVDVSGLTLAFAVPIPGNVLKGNWRAGVHVDQRATKQQVKAPPQATGGGVRECPGLHTTCTLSCPRLPVSPPSLIGE